jgi:hypothetical protein
MKLVDFDRVEIGSLFLLQGGFMDGAEVAELMKNSCLNNELAKHARRYSKRIEDQEEYIQDAWLRISQHDAGKTVEYYEEQGRKAIVASYWRRYRNVSKKGRQNANGISVTGEDAKPPPKRAIHVYANKYVDSKHTTIDWQYYEGQEEDIKKKAFECLEWYNIYEGFESLDKGVQEKVVQKFVNSGYRVGNPIGATPGKKIRFYEMYYNVSRGGLVERARNRQPTNKAVGNFSVIDEKRGDWGRSKVDLSTWYRLRGFGGTPEWMETLNAIIAKWEKYNSKKE